MPKAERKPRVQNAAPRPLPSFLQEKCIFLVSQVREEVILPWSAVTEACPRQVITALGCKVERSVTIYYFILGSPPPRLGPSNTDCHIHQLWGKFTPCHLYDVLHILRCFFPAFPESTLYHAHIQKKPTLQLQKAIYYFSGFSSQQLFRPHC